MKLLVLAALFVSTSAFAHIEPGIYKGLTADGKDCSMIAGKQYFDNNTPHPLNEKIPVSVNGKDFIVGHPPIINSKDSVVFFNHDLFQGLLPTSTGAQAIEIEMVHSAEFEGPRSFTFIENFWKANRKEAFKCLDIKHVE